MIEPAELNESRDMTVFKCNISYLSVVAYNFNFMFLVMPAVIIRQRKAIRRKNGVFIYFEGITGIILLGGIQLA